MQLSSNLQVLLEMKRRMKRNFVPYLFYLLFENALGVGLNVILAFVYMNLFSAVIGQDGEVLLRATLLFLISLVVTCIFYPLFRYSEIYYVKKTIEDSRNDAYEHILKLPIPCFDKLNKGELVSRMLHDLQQMEEIYLTHIGTIVSIIFYGAGSVVSLFILDWRYAIAIVALGTASTFFNSKWGNKIQVLSQKVQQSKAVMTQTVVEGIYGMETVKLFQLRDLFRDNLASENMVYNVDSTHLVRRKALLEGCNFLLASLSTFIIYMIGVLLVFLKMAQLPTLIAVNQLEHGVSSGFSGIGRGINQLQDSLSGAKRFLEIFQYKQEDMRLKLNEVSQFQENPLLVIERGSFGYDSSNELDSLCFDELSFTLRKGEFACLVGESGSGKSTILDVILCFRELNHGKIQINIGEKQISLLRLRELIAYVPQTPFICSGTIEENIRMGNEQASLSEILQAAKEADFYEFICSLPDGLKTVIEENGANLSGGQKQKLALARAFVKNAPFILLDEATSALDSESEALIISTLKKKAHEHQNSILMVSHRMTPITNADKVLYLKGGNLAAVGCHEELILNNSSYKAFISKTDIYE
ncbi:hypothetical protein DCC85_07595 [Paenibacillus sp. CAA11]|uniref:ABC transporter ATP-binding protein n=1 Tax=Paenibacillus sp. CAA11 TaxID=1532905 RepID=UPI000D3CCB9A|nr:ABC transporter ATP-binding protein [Paenibacillus sp. CAA11]AWB44094.1 hypothetical protein DCC85_07595 [Paenibacillus sp. CAA11]